MQIKAQAFATGKCEYVLLIFAILVSHKHHNISASIQALLRLIAPFKRYESALLFLKHNIIRRWTCFNKISSSCSLKQHCTHALQFAYSFLKAEADHEGCCKRCSGKTKIVASHAGLFAPFSTGMVTFECLNRGIHQHLSENICLVNFKV